MADQTFEMRVYVFDTADATAVSDAKATALLAWADQCPSSGFTPAGDPTATFEDPGTGPAGMTRAWLVTGPVTSS